MNMGVIACSMTGGSGCPDDETGRHYYAHIDPQYDGRICIDCGIALTASKRRKSTPYPLSLRRTPMTDRDIRIASDELAM